MRSDRLAEIVEFANSDEFRAYADEEQRKRYRRHNLRKNYSIDDRRIDAQAEKQGGVCYICGSAPGKRGLNVDHCHSTGKVRKLLCTRCNTALGALEDRELLPKLIAYLKEHSGRKGRN
jgi:hypothetical protein